MSFLHLRCVGSDGHKASTALLSRGMHQLSESRPHANQHHCQDSGAQRWRRSTGGSLVWRDRQLLAQVGYSRQLRINHGHIGAVGNGRGLGPARTLRYNKRSYHPNKDVA